MKQSHFLISLFLILLSNALCTNVFGMKKEFNYVTKHLKKPLFSKMEYKLLQEVNRLKEDINQAKNSRNFESLKINTQKLENKLNEEQYRKAITKNRIITSISKQCLYTAGFYLFSYKYIDPIEFLRSFAVLYGSYSIFQYRVKTKRFNYNEIINKEQNLINKIKEEDKK